MRCLCHRRRFFATGKGSHVAGAADDDAVSDTSDMSILVPRILPPTMLAAKILFSTVLMWPAPAILMLGPTMVHSDCTVGSR
jgi:hypothetical protein